MPECGFAEDAPRSGQFRKRLFHGHHAVGAADRNLRAQLMVVALPDQISNGVGRDHNLDRGVSRHAVRTRNQLLRDDGEKRQR